jgi:GTP-binding protein HflX
VDALPGAEARNIAEVGDARTVAISALTGQGLPRMLSCIEETLDEQLVSVDLFLPYQRGDLLGLIHQRGVILRETHDSTGTRIRGRIPIALLPRLEAYSVAPVSAARG